MIGNILNETRQKLLMTQIVGVILGCIICITSLKILLGGVTETRLINDRLMVFGVIIGIYVAVYFMTIRGFFANKIKALKKALNIMYHTDETSITVKHIGLFGEYIHGEFYKDRIGIIHYAKKPRTLKTNIAKTFNKIKENKILIPSLAGVATVLAFLLIMKL